jgi:ABC-type phosphate/phosphonate transport system substrate-binding protein
MRTTILIAALLLVGLTGAPRAEAGSRDFLICIPGSPGSSASAQSYLTPFFRRVESLAGWSAGATTGSYQPSYSGCLSQIRSGRPGFAVMALGAYLEQRVAHRLQVIGQVEMFAGAGQRLYLVVKRGAFKTVADLKGKRLTSNHLEEAKFLSRVMFAGKIDVTQHFVLRKVNATTKGMRDVARGRVDATIINDDELRTMKGRAFGKDLEIIHQSPPLPGAPLVAFRGNATAADLASLRRSIGGMCSGAEGRKLCLSAGIRAMRSATDATFAAMVRRFGR